jgi:hypothetical protein
VAAVAFHQDLTNDKWFIVMGADKKLRRIEWSQHRPVLDTKSAVCKDVVF